ncbi:MAG: hypothetical protein IPL15_06155 [Comamonadaceae bacterium]|nr:hypothetical protein [Comamonadaceae bacterium]
MSRLRRGLPAHVVDFRAKSIQACGGGFAAPRLLPAGFEGLGNADAPFVPRADGRVGAASYRFGAELGVVEQQRSGFAAGAFGGGELRLAGAHRRVRGLGQAHRLVQGQRSWGGRGLGTRGVCNGGQREGQRHEGESHRIILFVSQQQSDSAGKGRDGASCLADATQPRRRSARQG